jgi:hypothetical protein
MTSPSGAAAPPTRRNEHDQTPDPFTLSLVVGLASIAEGSSSVEVSPLEGRPTSGPVCTIFAG